MSSELRTQDSVPPPWINKMCISLKTRGAIRREPDGRRDRTLDRRQVPPDSHARLPRRKFERAAKCYNSVKGAFVSPPPAAAASLDARPQNGRTSSRDGGLLPSVGGGSRAVVCVPMQLPVGSVVTPPDLRGTSPRPKQRRGALL